MEFNNKTLIIGGLIVASILAMYLNYEQIALTIVAGLVGYLSKDISSVNSNPEVSSPDEDVSSDEVTGGA